jgi:hypothetical protein
MPLTLRERARRARPSGSPGSAIRIIHKSSTATWGPLLVAALAALLAAPALAQDERSTRAPDVGKVGGTSRLAFSGIVTTVDLDKKVLHVDTVEGTFTEIFPLKKGFDINSARGGRLKVQDLKPGMNVIVYYEQRRGRRNVKEIMVIAAEPPEGEKKDKDSSS